ncbi:MAG: hypothetical protein Q6362_012170 [Candidatus Wukongarchaeota archaeon]|nr:hypothetical protein [Candidatus Wukongarchaeota archaeon]
MKYESHYKVTLMGICYNMLAEDILDAINKACMIYLRRTDVDQMGLTDKDFYYLVKRVERVAQLDNVEKVR